MKGDLINCPIYPLTSALGLAFLDTPDAGPFSAVPRYTHTSMYYPQSHIAVSAITRRGVERINVDARALAGIDLVRGGRLVAVVLLVSLIIISG